MDRGAIFDDSLTYRYALWRVWNETIPALNVIGLNPSTATATEDDPTIRRCVGYAKAWGYGGLVMTNLFAYRSTDPNNIPQNVPDGMTWGVGLDNDRHLVEQAKAAGLVVLAWGAHRAVGNRAVVVCQLLRGVPLHCLRLTKNGYPAHPLYLPKTLKPVLYRAA